MALIAALKTERVRSLTFQEAFLRLIVERRSWMPTARSARFINRARKKREAKRKVRKSITVEN